MRTNKWMPLIILICVSILSMPTLAMGGSYQGTIQGFLCVTQGKVCPIGMEDPVAAVENVFVLHVKADEYYFVPNVDRGIMARHINQRIKIEGVMSPRFKAIKASDLYVEQEGKWKKTWSRNLEDEIYYEIMSGYPLDGS